MCGIAGYIGKGYLSSEKVVNTLNTMQRRGPDAQRHLSGVVGKLRYDLLHARLSIIDLDPRANQPYVFEHITLIFNGEIYNYVEIRAQLQKVGYQFNTASDTEVIVKAYHAWGSDFLDRLEGMWAIVLVDTKKGQVFLARDRFAEKPLFIFEQTHGFYFASEVKQIEAMLGHKLSPNMQQAYRYLVNGHKSLNKSGQQFYLNLTEVDFAQYWIVDQELNVSKTKYWNPQYRPADISQEDAIQKIQSALIRSVELRMRADVPLAFCLSGGVDSSAMASIAVKSLNQDVQTFSIIDKDPRYNELENIQATVNDLGCKHHFIELSPDYDYLAQLEHLVDYHDGPVATISYLVHSRLIEAMHDSGYKVSISGTGADELFTGYYDHFLLQLPSLNPVDREDRISSWNEFPAKAVRNPFLQDPERFVKDRGFRDHIYLNNDAFSGFLKHDFKESFFESHFSDDLLRNRMMNELFHEVVRVILKEDDLNSMYFSIENRSPFLDRQLFETAYSIPSKLLIQKGYNKYLLRESLMGILNDKVRLSREKKGFNASLESVINFKNPKHRDIILDNSALYDWIDRPEIEKLMRKETLSNSYKKFFFNFLNLKMWLN
jgi:asparagine synthase (glutamine-hydrolysing)